MDILFAIAAALAAVVLIAVLWYGAGRAGRLRRFARRHGGEASPYDAFDLQQTVAQLYAEDVYVGHSARLDEPTIGDNPPSPVYLLELHHEPEGLPRSTVVLLEVTNAYPNLPAVIRARMPSPETDEPPRFAELFAVTDGKVDDVPPNLADLLSKRAGELDWLPAIHLGADRVAVGSRGRVLADDGEWSALLELAVACKEALEGT